MSDALLAEVLATLRTDEERAEAVEAIDRLSTAIRDMCELFGTLYVAAALVGVGRKLAKAK